MHTCREPCGNLPRVMALHAFSFSCIIQEGGLHTCREPCGSIGLWLYRIISTSPHLAGSRTCREPCRNLPGYNLPGAMQKNLPRHKCFYRVISRRRIAHLPGAMRKHWPIAVHYYFNKPALVRLGPALVGSHAEICPGTWLYHASCTCRDSCRNTCLGTAVFTFHLIQEGGSHTCREPCGNIGLWLYLTVSRSPHLAGSRTCREPCRNTCLYHASCTSLEPCGNTCLGTNGFTLSFQEGGSHTCRKPCGSIGL